METKLYNQKAEEVGKVTLPDEIFSVKMNRDIVHEVVVAHLANSRSPFAHTKDRSEVRGGGKKPWRQKGTGRARHSSIRSPLWRGGGATFGPRKTDNYSKKVNKKARRKALFMVLSSKVKDSQFIVVDQFQINAPKTKEVSGIVNGLSKKMEGYGEKKSKKDSILLITSKKNRTLEKAAHNIPNVEILAADSLNVREIMKNKFVVLVQDAIDVIGKTYNA